jgi:hypothetical protein
MCNFGRRHIYRPKGRRDLGRLRKRWDSEAGKEILPVTEVKLVMMMLEEANTR